MEIYDCGKLKLILGRTGSGKSYAVKHWLRRTEKKVLIVGFPEEYKGCDVIDCRKLANIIEAAEKYDVVVFDPYPLDEAFILAEKGKTVIIVDTEKESYKLDGCSKKKLIDELF